jgi:hypothetical protein
VADATKYYVYAVVATGPQGQRVLYIGKGTGDRDRWFLGHKVTVARLVNNLTEPAALEAEKFWVDLYGRSTLYNAVLGGTTNGALVTRGQKRRPIKPKE